MALISKKQVRAWLTNYQALASGDRPPDFVPGNSGCKPSDGITGSQMNKIMLDAAVKALPDLVRACVGARWIRRLPLGKTLALLGISKDVYYKRCEWGVDFIYAHVNGKRANIQALIDKIREIS